MSFLSKLDLFYLKRSDSLTLALCGPNVVGMLLHGDMHDRCLILVSPPTVHLLTCQYSRFAMPQQRRYGRLKVHTHSVLQCYIVPSPYLLPHIRRHPSFHNPSSQSHPPLVNIDSRYLLSSSFR
eukprot:52252-Eustigmatos_ZCMA.PRE.1